ncbi:type IV pilus secretin PilQ [Aquisalimonas asiatica]|uniref:Type IV pilus assembly protein PilQ n=1 Tax=Aquisalimonas asiatica TaxID=406100 RepID=A0A1H8TGF9_9GAMM|nr:type IV pilus secretin PilQ [Aquisalimonas asiatica]SEO89856.1 type IV pilus assembly protein PilQ [Aquisalimonas asiatica]
MTTFAKDRAGRVASAQDRRRSPTTRLGTRLLMTAAGLLMAAEALAENALRDISYSTLPGNRVQISVELENPPEEPSSFTIDDPARITFDFPDTRNRLESRSMQIGVGAIEGVSSAEADGRSRLVLNLSEMTEYDTRIEGNTLHIFLGGAPADAPADTAEDTAATTLGDDAPTTAPPGSALEDIDFQRGSDGAGRVVIELNDDRVPVDLRRSDGQIQARFRDTEVPERLQRRLNVVDFATPVETIETRQDGSDTLMRIQPIEGEDYDYMGYQAGNQFTIEFRPVTEEEREAEEPEYTGERLSLSFQDIEVRSVLQIIADFTGLNVVVSDSVTGNITLRLQNVPWDQALDIILQTKGLDKRVTGNVMLVGPADEIAARERQQLEAQQELEEMAPLRSEFFEINYSTAAELAGLIRSEETSLLSSRGQVAIDERTNTLIIRDTDQNLSSIRSLVNRLDVPVRQVLIESRIVIANDDFSRDLGVRFGASASGSDAVIGGTQDGAFEFDQTTGFETPAGSGQEGLMVDLPVDSAAGSVGLAVGRIGDRLLQLELSAMETEGRGEVVSSPRVITSNQKTASIRQGVEIPYQEATASGATNVSFQEALLALDVTPQITPDERIIMDLEVSQDTVGQVFDGVPSIDTQSVTTQVLVDNGETVVLGGIYERERREQESRVPFFGSLPAVGWLFRNRQAVDENSELLIFVTPRILQESLSGDSAR